MKSSIFLLECLFVDYKRLLQCEKELDRDLQTIKFRCEHEGITFLSHTLPKLCDALDYGLSHGRFTCPTDFKKVKKGALPKLFSGLLCNVFDSHGILQERPSIEHVRVLREVTRFCKKLQLTSNRSEVLHADAVKSFIDTDQRIRSINVDQRLLFRIAKIGSFIVPGLEDLDDLHYRHGPGAVQEGFKGNEKWSAVFEQISNHDLGNFVPELTEHAALLGYSSGGQGPLVNLENRIAKLITVPKTATAARTITVEPMLNQFIQQGLNTHLRDNIKKCGILRECLALTDQSKNQQLALDGSLTGAYSTIDLKSASDLLSLTLVKTIFQSKPFFLERLVNCRSTHISTDKRVIEMSKYAGMGNATTFPVQSIAFALICIDGMLDQDGKPLSYRNVQRAALRIQVYGDDIIVPTEYYHTVRNRIHAFGLVVNESKTFFEGNFRESCGVDAYLGVDVTPTYLRQDPFSQALNASSLISLIKTSNQLWLRGLYATSNAIRMRVEELLNKKLPIVRSNSGLLGWSDRYDSTEAHSWDKALHRLRVHSYSVRSKKRIDKIDGQAALLKFYFTNLLERSGNHLEQSTIRYNIRLVKAKGAV